MQMRSYVTAYNYVIFFTSDVGGASDSMIILFLYIEFKDSTGLNYIMFAHNSVVLRN